MDISFTKKTLIVSNVVLLVALLFALKYETPGHRRADALMGIIGFGHTPNLSETHPVYHYTSEAIKLKTGEDKAVNWSGVEWTHVYSTCRIHATTEDGRRYVVHLLLAPNGEQSFDVQRWEVVDVSNQVTLPGLEHAGKVKTPEMFYN